MEFDKSYQLLWLILNALILIYGLVILIVVKCCKIKKKYSSSVSKLYILSFFYKLQRKIDAEDDIFAINRDTSIQNINPDNDDKNDNLIQG